jgi:uncharacterized protein
MYPFGSLPDNLAAFCDMLRRSHRFRIGAGELHDAARALELVDLGDAQAVRDALRPILSATSDDVRGFDAAFAEFFFTTRGEAWENEVAATRLEPGASASGSGERAELERTATDRHAESDDEGDGAARPLRPADASDIESEAQGRLERSTYSPLAAASADVPTLTPVDADWTAAARTLVDRVQLGLSRRWRQGATGTRFDLRRTLRASLHTGGEPLRPRWLRRRLRAPRFVVLIDGSRSMSGYTQTALRLVVALAGATRRLEVLTFSTSLQRITSDVRRAAAGESRRVEGLEFAWGGGTSIGACLREFLQKFGARALGPATLTIVASDGLDVGNPRELAGAVAELRRRSAALIWLNPLLETEGYEPSASGMTAARPHVTAFLNVRRASDLASLARLTASAKASASQPASPLSR